MLRSETFLPLNRLRGKSTQKAEGGENHEKAKTFLTKIFPLSTSKHLFQQFESKHLNTDGLSLLCQLGEAVLNFPEDREERRNRVFFSNKSGMRCRLFNTGTEI